MVDKLDKRIIVISGMIVLCIVFFTGSYYHTIYSFKQELTPVCQELGYNKATDYKRCANMDGWSLYNIECDSKELFKGVKVDILSEYKCISHDKWGDCDMTTSGREYYISYNESYKHYLCED